MEITNACKIFKKLKKLKFEVRNVIKDAHKSVFKKAVLPNFPNAQEKICEGHTSQNVKKNMEKIQKILGLSARKFYQNMTSQFCNNYEEWVNVMGIPSKHYRNNHTLCNNYHTHPKNWKKKEYKFSEIQLKKIDKIFANLAAHPEKNCHTFKTALDESFFHKKLKWVPKLSGHPTHYPFWVNLAALDEIYGPKWTEIVQNMYFFGNTV
jgi:hypothetical protein